MGTQFWCDRQITIRVEGPDGGRTIDVGKPYARIGSHRRSEVILEGPTVPKLGLYLHATERGIFCAPLTKPENGSDQVGQWLADDRSVALGDYQVCATFTDGTGQQVDGLPRLDEKGSAPLPIPVIYVLVNEQRRATYRAYRSLTVVGREQPSALRLKSELISSAHCVLYWQDGRLWFIDLLSSNGTEKRGRRRDAERLRLGKTIKLGDVRLGFARTSDEPWRAPEDEAAHVEQSFPTPFARSSSHFCRGFARLVVGVRLVATRRRQRAGCPVPGR